MSVNTAVGFVPKAKLVGTAVLLGINNVINRRDVRVMDNFNIEYLKNYVPKNWHEFFEKNDLFSLLFPILLELNAKRIIPNAELVFKCFELTGPEELKAVILGQDPYPDNNRACGLAFSVPSDYTGTVPLSLQNIKSEVMRARNPKDETEPFGDLSGWATSGVLLLNTALTIGEGNSSHLKLWKNFTRALISALAKEKELIFVLWGQKAHDLLSDFQGDTQNIFRSSHPSSRSYKKRCGEYSCFLNSDVFSKVNNRLLTLKKSPIKW